MNSQITLDINPETVSYIAGMARDLTMPEQMEGGDDTPLNVTDWDSATTAGAGNADPVYAELRTAIEDLEPDQQVQLVALMWLGRGSFTVDEWQAAVTEAKENWNPKSADYLIGTPLLADYLEEGLSQLDYHLEDSET